MRINFYLPPFLCLIICLSAYAQPASHEISPQDTTKTAYKNPSHLPANKREQLFLNAAINFEQINQPAETYYNSQTKALLLSEQALRLWGLTPLKKVAPKQNIRGKPYYNILNIPDLTYVVNTLNQSVTIHAPAKYFAQQTHVLQRDSIKKTNQGTLLWGPFITTDISAFLDSSDNNNLTDETTVGLFSPIGSFSQSMLIRPKFGNTAQPDKTWVALNTLLRHDNPRTLMTYQLGNDTTTSNTWAGTAQYAGIKIAKDFDLNPNVITFPEPTITGNTALPATVQLSINGVPVSKQQVQSGQFQLNNIPATTGNGTIAVKTTNVLGQTTTQYVPYFVSPTLLAKGLNNYSLDAGILRQSFGTHSFDYAHGFGVGTYAQGITHNWTAEGYAAGLSDLQVVGLTNTVSILGGNADATLAGSRLSTHQDGGLLSIGYEHAGIFGYGASATFTTPHFSDLALFDSSTAPSKYQFQLFSSVALKHYGNLSLSYFQQLLRPSASSDSEPSEPPTKQLTLTYTTLLDHDFFLIIDGSYDSDNQWSTGLSIEYQFHNDHNTLSYNNAFTKNGNDNTLLLTGDSSLHQYGWQYDVEAARFGTQASTTHALTTTIANHNHYGNYDMTGTVSDSTNTLSINAALGATWLHHHFYVTPPITNSIALVSLPKLNHIHVRLNHEPYGQTNASGKLLVPNLVAFFDNTLNINMDELPFNATLNNPNRNVIPGYLTASLVKFNIALNESASLYLVNAQGKALSIGTSVHVNQLPQDRYKLGYNGLLYLSHIPQNIQTLTGTAQHNKQICHFAVTLNHANTFATYRDVLCKNSAKHLSSRS